MTKIAVILSVLISVCAYVACDNKYTTKYDDIDIESILRSERLLQNYINCLLDKGRCTPDGAELKKNIPDALQYGCTKCSEVQRKNTKRIINFLIKEKKSSFDALEKKYDPQRNYRKRFADEIKREGILIDV